MSSDNEYFDDRPKADFNEEWLDDLFDYFTPLMKEPLSFNSDEKENSVILGRSINQQDKLGLAGTLFIGRICEKNTGYYGLKTLIVRAKKELSIFILLLIIINSIYTPPVLGISIDTVVPSSGVKGDTIVVTGSGVTAGVDVNVYWDAVKAWDGEKGFLNSTDATSVGTFVINFKIPESVNGYHYIWIKNMKTGETTRAENPFIIFPHIQVSSRFGVQGSSVSIAGSGFSSNQEINVKLDDVNIKTFQSDKKGSFSGVFTVPAVSSDWYTLTAYDGGSTLTASTIFKVGVIIVIISPSSGPRETQVTLTGTGFTANSNWEAIFGDILILENQVVDSDTNINGQFKVPNLPFGTYTISITEIETEITVYVEFEIISDTSPIKLEISWMSPPDNTIIESQNVDLSVRVVSNGISVPNAVVSFYVNDEYLEKTLTDKNGYSSTKYLLSGNLTWYVIAEKSEYYIGISPIQNLYYRPFPPSKYFFLEIINEIPELLEYTEFSGDGYYEEGSTVVFKISPTIIQISAKIRYKFTGWISEIASGYSGLDNPASVIMTNNITEIAKWKTQYYVAVEVSEGGGTSPSSDWYDEGERITINAIPNSGYKFTRWNGSGSGSYSGSQISHTITVNGPITQTASFTPIPVYTLSVESAH